MRFQHGGPPAALLARAVDRDPNKLVARVAFDILKPVPLAPLTVTSNVVRPGKRVELVEAALIHEGAPVMRASAWRVRTTEQPLDSNERPNPYPGPEEGKAPSGFFSGEVENQYLHSMEWCFIENEFLKPGPSVAWLRMRIPLVDGEETSPLARVVIAADSASGISSELDFSRWLFINPDLTVVLDRLPEGEWVCLDARTVVPGNGVGLATSRIYDRKGEIGGTAQTLLIDDR